MYARVRQSCLARARVCLRCVTHAYLLNGQPLSGDMLKCQDNRKRMLERTSPVQVEPRSITKIRQKFPQFFGYPTALTLGTGVPKKRGICVKSDYDKGKIGKVGAHPRRGDHAKGHEGHKGEISSAMREGKWNSDMGRGSKTVKSCECHVQYMAP